SRLRRNLLRRSGRPAAGGFRADGGEGRTGGRRRAGMRVLLMSYHDGELEAQRRAGVSDLASRVGRIIRPTIPPAAAQFLAERSFVVAATVSGDGRVHASALAGAARALDDTTIVLHPASGHLAVVREDVAATGLIGLLAIDFATKRRMR